MEDSSGRSKRQDGKRSVAANVVVVILMVLSQAAIAVAIVIGVAGIASTLDDSYVSDYSSDDRIEFTVGTVLELVEVDGEYLRFQNRRWRWDTGHLYAYINRDSYIESVELHSSVFGQNDVAWSDDDGDHILEITEDGWVVTVPRSSHADGA